MPAYGNDREALGQRQIAAAITVLVMALATTYLPDDAQQRVAGSLRATALRPFIVTQELVTDARIRAADAAVLRAQLDSLTAALSTQAALAEENRTLRDLLNLSTRVGPAYKATSIIRPGTPGSESMFLLFLDEGHGVRPGSPVISRHGLVGAVREVRGRTAVGMDWTHPDFRASAMLGDGTAMGIVENRRGAFREQDRLVLNGTAYYEDVPVGVPVLTSGLGVFPRGIPIGVIDGVAETEGRWRKSYWLRPMIEPGAVTHVLVAVGDAPSDLTSVWPTDSVLPRSEAILRDQTLADTVRVLRSLLEERLDSAGGR